MKVKISPIIVSKISGPGGGYKWNKQTGSWIDLREIAAKQSKARAIKHGPILKYLIRPNNVKADCDAWKVLDSFYTAFAEDLRPHWRTFFPTEKLSTYDKFMAYAMRQTIRGCYSPAWWHKPSVTIYPRKFFEFPNPTSPLIYNRAWIPIPDSCQTQGLYYARCFQWYRSRIRPPRYEDWYQWVYVEVATFSHEEPGLFFAGLWDHTSLHPPTRGTTAIDWWPYHNGYASFVIAPDYPVAATSVEIALPMRNPDGSLIRPIAIDHTRRVTCEYLTTNEIFTHWPRINQQPRGFNLFATTELRSPPIAFPGWKVTPYSGGDFIPGPGH
jgi:hypothetical protein